MPSTYTLNTGVEKPASGEQSGSWGATVNTNMDILDRAINGVVTIPLTGTSSTLTTNDGSLSDGQNKLLIYTGTLAAAHTVTIDPADAQKVYYVQNDTNQSLIFTQGTGANNATVISGKFSIIYADGSDECHNLTDSVALGAGGFSVGGVDVTATAAELNLLDDAQAGTVVAEKAAVYGAAGELAATTVEIGSNWSVTESAGGELIFSSSSVQVAKLDTSGNLTVIGDITAFGTI